MRSTNRPYIRAVSHAPLLALAAGAVIVLAACGSTNSGSSPPRSTSNGHSAQVDAAFAQRAAAACRQGNQLNLGGPPPPYPKFNPQHPTVSEMPAMGRWIQAGVAPARQALRLAERLGQPASGAVAWNHFLAAAGQWLSELQTQATSLKHSQVKAFIATTRGLHTDANGYLGAAVNAGVRDCGGIFGPQG